MKKLTFLFVMFSVFTAAGLAQAPGSFNYQAVVRDAAGNPLNEQDVDVEVKILKDGVTFVYCETQNVSTNGKGLVTLKIGEGTLCSPNNPLSSVDWKTGAFTMTVKVSHNGNTVAIESPLLSVPFAMHAETVTDKDDADADPGNEIQTISKSGNTVTLSRGGGAFTDEVNDADASASNEIQTLSFSSSNGILGLSRGGGQVNLSGISPWAKSGSNIRYNGNVGIGANPGRAKLEISGSLNSSPGIYHTFRFYAVNSYVNLNNTSSQALSIYAASDIATRGLHVFSDARIKNIQGVSDGKEDLETLKQIEITDYYYKDYISQGTAPQKKVVAQQVAEVYPQAVTGNNTEIIPDIMKKATARDGWVSLEGHSLKKGERVRLILEDRQEDMEVVEAQAGKFKVEGPAEGEVFVYGREVHDFHTVDYEAIAMLNVSATQELARIIGQQQAEIARLKAANDQVMARLGALEAAGSGLAQRK